MSAGLPSHFGLKLKDISHMLGLTEAEFDRYFASGIVKITVDHSPSSDIAPMVAIEFGNKVLTVTDQPDAPAKYDIRYRRGKLSGFRINGREVSDAGSPDRSDADATAKCG